MRFLLFLTELIIQELKAWVIKELQEIDLISYDYAKADNETSFYYIEEWTEEYYKVTINNKVLNINGDPTEGPNCGA